MIVEFTGLANLGRCTTNDWYIDEINASMLPRMTPGLTGTNSLRQGELRMSANSMRYQSIESIALSSRRVTESSHKQNISFCVQLFEFFLCMCLIRNVG